MPISWEYYAKRRRIQVDAWVKKMKFKSYDDFLKHLSDEDIRPPVEPDARVKDCIEALAKTTGKESDKPQPKKTASQKRSKSQSRSRGSGGKD